MKEGRREETYCDSTLDRIFEQWMKLTAFRVVEGLMATGIPEEIGPAGIDLWKTVAVTGKENQQCLHPIK